MTRTIGVALLGLGNVGGGVVKLLEDNAAAIAARLGAKLEVRAIAVRDVDKAHRVVAVDRSLLTSDVEATVRRGDIEIVCELIGGTTLARHATLAAIAVGSVIGLVILHRYRVGAVAFLNRTLEPFGRRIRKGVTSVVGHFAESLSILHDRRELVVVSAWSILLWIVCAVVNSLVFSAFGLSLSLLGAIFVMGFGLIGSLVPTPGGAAGAFHMATAVGLMMLGVGESDAKSITIVLHLIVFGSALPLGLFYLLRGGYSLSRLRAAISEDFNSMPDFATDVGYEPAINGLGPEEVKIDR